MLAMQTMRAVRVYSYGGPEQLKGESLRHFFEFRQTAVFSLGQPGRLFFPLAHHIIPFWMDKNYLQKCV